MSSLGIWGFPTSVVVILYYPLHPKCLPLRRHQKPDTQNLPCQGLTLEMMQPMSLGGMGCAMQWSVFSLCSLLQGHLAGHGGMG